MKTLILSDLHLTHVFNKRKAAFLKQLISSCDTVVLNGDFWDGYITTFDTFVTSDWKKLFPLFKEKKTVYLYGNHDQKRFSDDRVSLFSIAQKESHQLKLKEVTYHIEHGHVLYPCLEKVYPLSRKSLYYANIVFQKIEHVLTLLKSPHNVILKQANKKVKSKLKKQQFPHWYLCGHSHCAEIDNKNKFANSGFVRYGKASYLIIDSLGPHLHTNHYK